MKTIVKKWTDSNLIIRIMIFLSVGVLLGMLLPELSGISVLGSVFVGALKGIAPILVFVLVSSALTKADLGVGRRFRTVIILYLVSTFSGAITAAGISFIWPVKMEFPNAAVTESAPPSGISEVLTKLLTNIVDNPVSAMVNANYIGILFWAVLLGLALRKFAQPATISVFEDISDAVSTIVRWIIQCAPFGIMGLVFTAVSISGLAIFTSYGKLLAVLVGCMLIVALVITPLIAFVAIRRNPYPLVLTCLKESGITAFFTRSSAANIPVNLRLCQRLDLDEDFYSVSIPLGATINMNGAAITITIMTLSTAYTIGSDVDVPTAIVLSILAALGACGASGVAGGSLLLIPMACSMFGIGNDIAMQAVAVGFIIGVIQDSMETALDSSGDVIFTASAEFCEKRKRNETIFFYEEGLLD